jgi:hypothetical protein
VSDLFCRHNRFTADCPICSKGTVLDSSGAGTARPRASRAASGQAKKQSSQPGGAAFRGPYASAGPYDRDGASAEVRLERVPGGVRLAEWSAGALLPHAPVLPAADLRELIAQARERALLPERDLEKLEAAVGAEPQPAGAGGGPSWGASRGRTADLQEELRVEEVGEGRVRLARWILRPGAGWELQDAPPMLPAARFAEAIASAVRAGAV